MARRWTLAEEVMYRKELTNLYITRNKTIGEIAPLLGIRESSVFDRMQRLGIQTTKETKPHYLNRRSDVVLPEHSAPLAEFLGIMLGDGHVSHFQTVVTLGSKELAYVRYVQRLMQHLFQVPARICPRPKGYRDVYIGSTLITAWLGGQGLVHNKVKAQVGVPLWIMDDPEYMRAFVRGFFDTDGSVYRLRFGIQLSFTNYSAPILTALQNMLRRLGYRVSEASLYRIYITRREDVWRFFKEIAPANSKHRRRFDKFARRWQSGKCTTL